jgi:cell division protein FtsA
MVPRQTLHDILAPRAHEVLSMAVDEMRRAELAPHLGAGVVLAGGGARLHGICDLAEQIFSSPARIGLPSECLTQDGLAPNLLDLPDTLNAPEYTVLVALLLYAFRLHNLRSARQRTPARGWKDVLGRGAREGVR